MSPKVHQRICAPVLSEDGGSFSKTGGSCSFWRSRTWKILRSYKYQKEMLLSLSSIKTFRLFFLEILDFQGEGPEFHSGRTRCILKFLVFPPSFLWVTLSKFTWAFPVTLCLHSVPCACPGQSVPVSLLPLWELHLLCSDMRLASASGIDVGSRFLWANKGNFSTIPEFF